MDGTDASAASPASGAVITESCRFVIGLVGFRVEIRLVSVKEVAIYP